VHNAAGLGLAAVGGVGLDDVTDPVGALPDPHADKSSTVATSAARFISFSRSGNGRLSR
jgi:hypothetical protein